MTAVHQLVPNLTVGDAISGQVLALQAMLRKLGRVSEIYAEHLDPRIEGAARRFDRLPDEIGPNDVVVFHFSIGSDVTDLYRRLPHRRVLVHHNVTPPKWFHGVNEAIAARCAAAREELAALRSTCVLGLADSEFNRLELEAAGYERTAVLPIVLDPNRTELKSVRRLERLLGDGEVNLLHVGRLAPNKRIEDLIKVFYFFRKKVNPRSRLSLVGIDTDTEIYSFGLRELVRELGVASVDFAGGVTPRELVTYYRAADVYLGMSEHEGFCAPVVEAMHFGVPVVAFDAGAVAETLGNAGALVVRKDHAAIAELLGVVLEDAGLRSRMIDRGHRRAREFAPEAVEPRLRQVLELLESA